MNEEWMKFTSQVLRIWLTGTAYPHGYWRYDSQVFYIVYTGKLIPFCRDTPQKGSLTGYLSPLHLFLFRLPSPTTFSASLMTFHVLSHDFNSSPWLKTLLWGFFKYEGGRGDRQKFSWQILKTCKCFVIHILTPKRCQNLNPWKFHVLSQLFMHNRKEVKLSKVK